MGTRISKLAVLVMLCTVGIGSSTRVLAQPEQDGQSVFVLSWENRLGIASATW